MVVGHSDYREEATLRPVLRGPAVSERKKVWSWVAPQEKSVCPDPRGCSVLSVRMSVRQTSLMHICVSRVFSVKWVSTDGGWGVEVGEQGWGWGVPGPPVCLTHLLGPTVGLSQNRLRDGFT